MAEMKDLVESSPIDSLDDLLRWKPPKNYHLRESLIKLKPSVKQQKSGIIFCHDMNNNYHEDRFDQGTNNFDAYLITKWKYIDAFVYFSHHRITIPPFVWRVAAHRNGCKILGTFIIEFDPEVMKSFENMLLTRMELLVEKLVLVCIVYGFDGYLINLECRISAVCVKHLNKFLDLLKQKLKKTNPIAEVIWYDSLIHNGSLIYQNSLCPLNKCFFDNCTAFYSNYNWNHNHLDLMLKNYARELNKIYLGIDLFIRCKIEHSIHLFGCTERFHIARELGFPVIFFAIGYFYEVRGKEKFLEEFDDFFKGLSANLLERNIQQFPFYSNMCIGRGHNFYLFGKTVKGSFNNLSLQSFLPNTQMMVRQNGTRTENMKAIIKYSDGYNGGSCLYIQFPTSRPLKYFLFKTELNTSVMCGIRMVIKGRKLIKETKIALELVYEDKKTLSIFLNDLNQEKPKDLKFFYEDQDMTEHFTGGIEFDDSWSSLFYVVTRDGDASLKLKQLNLVSLPLSNGEAVECELLVGELSLFDCADLDFDWNILKINGIEVKEIQYRVDSNFNFACLLTWNLKIDSDDYTLFDYEEISLLESIDIYIYYGNNYYFVGKCMSVGQYYVEHTGPPISEKCIKLYLQPMLKSGIRQQIRSCPNINVDLL